MKIECRFVVNGGGVVRSAGASVCVLFSLFFALAAVISIDATSCAAQAQTQERVSKRPPKTALEKFNIFDRATSAKQFFGSFKGEVVVLERPAKQDPEAESTAKENGNARDSENSSSSVPDEKTSESKSQVATHKTNSALWSDDPNDIDVRPPDERLAVRVNPEAPSSIHGLISSIQTGDETMSDAYADQFVRYLEDYFFLVRRLTGEIGEALIRKKQINEEQWVGVEQMINYEMASSRLENGAVIKPTHEASLRQISPDSAGKARVFYFFTLNCSWCRYMASDVERLWLMFKDDPNVEFAALTLGPARLDWLDEYRAFTGLSMPIFDGSALAEEFNIGFVPAVVIISPSNNRSYLRTGKQKFEHMYELVKTVQGREAKVTPRFKKLLSTPIGQGELAYFREQHGKPFKGSIARFAGAGESRNSIKRARFSPERF